MSEHVQAVEWEKTALQELDITATDLTTECLTDLLVRVPALRWLSAGQQDGFNDSVTWFLSSFNYLWNENTFVTSLLYRYILQVLRAFGERGNAKHLVALDLDASDNLSEDALYKFLTKYGSQLRGLCLAGMPHITDQLWISVLPILKNCSKSDYKKQSFNQPFDKCERLMYICYFLRYFHL